MRVNGWLAATGLVLAAFATWIAARACAGPNSPILSPACAAAVCGGAPSSSSTAPKCTAQRIKTDCISSFDCITKDAGSDDKTKNCTAGDCGTKDICSAKIAVWYRFQTGGNTWKKISTTDIQYNCGLLCDPAKSNLTCTKDGDQCKCKGPDCPLLKPEKTCVRATDTYELCG